MECIYYSQGRCRFGKSCRNKHISRSELLDPPRWILGSNFSKDPSSETRYSMEEVRLFYYNAYRAGMPALEAFFTAWNQSVIASYNAVVQEINKLEETANVLEGVDGRTVDIRKNENFEYIINPVPIEAVLSQIAQNYNPMQIYPRHPAAQYNIANAGAMNNSAGNMMNNGMMNGSNLANSGMMMNSGAINSSNSIAQNGMMNSTAGNMMNNGMENGGNGNRNGLNRNEPSEHPDVYEIGKIPYSPPRS
ncbi:hypothetical protein NEMIN01_0717 [Nematocida minor]|uniref:uncharacterized protein n=1 Tax=Nematocida minor TaxID=1912983 RepID=UPI0022202569|nr:uncharacterized protein NEMIN01_0717 [Nematocida minor]KAI5189854.1 hypothetical protein NEMIN01_0717 [Nematocida minor]